MQLYIILKQKRIGPKVDPPLEPEVEMTVVDDRIFDTAKEAVERTHSLHPEDSSESYHLCKLDMLHSLTSLRFAVN
jgi:hypothetical protein